MNKAAPDGWSLSNLGSVAELTMGQSPSSNTYNDVGDGLPFFQGKADFGTHNPTVRVWCSEPTKIAEENSILFSVRAPVGDVNITPVQCCIGRGLAAITGTSVNQSYLYQKIQFVNHRFQLVAQGSTFEAVNGSEMRDFPLALPPLPEQQKIAAILSSVDDVIEKTRSQIDKLKDLKTGMMQELLTRGIGHTEFKDSPVGRIPAVWDVVQVNDVADVVDSMHQTPSFSEIGIPMVRVTEIRQGEILDISGAVLVDEETFNLFTRNYQPKHGDTLIARVGAYFGATAFIDDEYQFCLGQNTASIRPQGICAQYLFDFLNSESGRSQMEDAVAVGAQPSLSLKAVKELKVPIPPLGEQQKISDAISSVRQKILIVCDKLDSLNLSKRALMQDLLTGKVRVKVD